MVSTLPMWSARASGSRSYLGQHGDLSGLDLKVGGEGMKAFYDQLLPDWVRSYGKKYGLRLEQVPATKGARNWSFKITPELRRAVREEGQAIAERTRRPYRHPPSSQYELVERPQGWRIYSPEGKIVRAFATEEAGRRAIERIEQAGEGGSPVSLPQAVLLAEGMEPVRTPEPGEPNTRLPSDPYVRVEMLTDRDLRQMLASADRLAADADARPSAYQAPEYQDYLGKVEQDRAVLQGELARRFKAGGRVREQLSLFPGGATHDEARSLFADGMPRGRALDELRRRHPKVPTRDLEAAVRHAYGEIPEREVAFGSADARRAAIALARESVEHRLGGAKGAKGTWVDVRGAKLSTNPALRAEQTAKLLRPFRSPLTEKFHVLLLNDEGRILSHTMETSGALNYVMFRDRTLQDIGRRAERVGATKVILAHNHPSGDATPSPEDRAITRHWARELGQRFGLRDLEHYVLDHGVVGVIRHEPAPGVPPFSFTHIRGVEQEPDWSWRSANDRAAGCGQLSERVYGGRSAAGTAPG